MQEFPKYHLGDQQAAALLHPMILSLCELEDRAKHYLDRLHLSNTERAAVVAAHAAIRAAHTEVTAIWQKAQATNAQGEDQ